MIDHPMFLHRLHLLCNPLIDNVFIGIHPNFPTYPPLPFHFHTSQTLHHPEPNLRPFPLLSEPVAYPLPRLGFPFSLAQL